MTEVEIQSIALFFYFALLDDKKAVEASTQALALCRERKSRNPSLKSSVLMVSGTKAVWDKFKVRVARGRPNTSTESGWIIPAGLDLGPWREFQKNASEDELLTVIWSKILNIDDKDLSEGLGITPGTVRYRLGRSLRKLGTMTQVSGKTVSRLQYGTKGK